MAVKLNRNITKAVIDHLDPVPVPDEIKLLQVRFGKVSTLVDEPSGIFKEEKQEQCFVSKTGLTGDEHVYPPHGGIERAVMGYASTHYESWRCEETPLPELFQYGAFGENLVIDGLTEENVCLGDLYRIGQDVILQVSEPRNPCYKINKRFQWPRALKRTQQTARVGWLMRVIQTGWVQKGECVVLIERPHPRWSLLNVKRVLQGKTVPLELVQELAEIKVLTEMVRDLAYQRLETSAKTYELAECEKVTARVKKLTFQLKEPVTINRPEFSPFSFAKMEFGPDFEISRSYSIVSGDLNRFTLGVAYDDHSRGGSAYIHDKLKLGDEVRMAPGSSPPTAADESDEETDIGEATNRVVIIGGIGITAFLSTIEGWEREGLPYHVHYAVRSPEEAAFCNKMPPEKTTMYAKSRGERLSVDEVIPALGSSSDSVSSIYCCGPTGLMNACEKRAKSLNYPGHLLHFESFGVGGAGPLGEPFEVEVNDLDSGRTTNLTVPEDKTLLQVIRAAGFETTFGCQVGGCGACRIGLRKGQVCYNGTGLPKSERANAMLCCVDRGIGKIEIELD